MPKIRWMQVMWPSFLVAGVAETVFFAFFDPTDIVPFGDSTALSRTTVYSFGFLLFWLFAAASSSLTCYLQRSADEINACPLAGPERPSGCPKREEPGGN